MNFILYSKSLPVSKLHSLFKISLCNSQYAMLIYSRLIINLGTLIIQVFSMNKTYDIKFIQILLVKKRSILITLQHLNSFCRFFCTDRYKFASSKGYRLSIDRKLKEKKKKSLFSGPKAVTLLLARFSINYIQNS